jgi:signal transduction histidine kinase
MEDFAEILPSQGMDYARRMRDAARRMEVLIQDLLAYSRLSRKQIRLRPVDLGRVLEEVLDQLDEEIQRRGAEVSVRGPLPMVRGHHTTLVQVLANLITNAMTFVSAGTKPRVTIRAQDADERIRIWVEDNGIGIPSEHRQRIFRIFERLHGIEAYPGTGVGLAIVKKGVERLGGQVGVESEEGKGSRFWVELSIADWGDQN